MPSSHSALVTGTAAGVGWQMGFDQPAFALAATVAFVVMYDASGVRRAAGFTAARLNELPDSLWPNPPEKPLKERSCFDQIHIGPNRTRSLLCQSADHQRVFKRSRCF